MGFDLGNLLQQYLGGAIANQHQANDDFDRVAQAAPRGDLAQGVTQALRSDQTPPFPQLVSQLFSNGSPDQRAGMLNKLLANVGPGVLASVAGGALGNLRGADQGRISPDQATQVSPDAVRQLAEQAEQQNPGIVERMGDFYAEHPNLVKGLGGAALAVALGYMAQGMQRNQAAAPGSTQLPPNHNDKESNMGILGDIFHKIFPSRHPANQAKTGQQTAPAQQPQQVPQQPQVQPQVQQAPVQQPAAPAVTAIDQVDVEEILTNLQKQSGQQLNWRTSIVDLLKLLNLDSSLQARKELAAELHYTGDTGDSAKMNIWLHRQVMNKLAENGGKVPADLKD